MLKQRRGFAYSETLRKIASLLLRNGRGRRYGLRQVPLEALPLTGQVQAIKIIFYSPIFILLSRVEFFCFINEENALDVVEFVLEHAREKAFCLLCFFLTAFVGVGDGE